VHRSPVVHAARLFLFLALAFSLILASVLGCAAPVTPGLQVTPEDGTLITTRELRLTVTRQFPGNGPVENVTSRVSYASSNPAVATVGNGDADRGVVRAGTQPGTVVVRIVDPDSAAVTSVTLTVEAPRVVTLDISPTPAAVLARGAIQQFRARATFNDGTESDVTPNVSWTSTNVAAALVGDTPVDKGIVRAIAAGDTTIVATDPVTKVQARTAVFVTGEPASIVALVVTPNPALVAVGKTQAFTALAVLSDGSTKNLTNQVTWSSSRVEIATVDAAGVVTGVAPGDVTITAIAPEPSTTIRGSAAAKVVP